MVEDGDFKNEIIIRRAIKDDNKATAKPKGDGVINFHHMSSDQENESDRFSDLDESVDSVESLEEVSISPIL